MNKNNLKKKVYNLLNNVKLSGKKNSELNKTNERKGQPPINQQV